MLPLLLAQLIAPPLQPGPVRLPAPVPQLRPVPAPEPAGEPSEPVPRTIPSPGAFPLPLVEGLSRYPASDLEQLLAPCGAIADPNERLNTCAALLSSRLVADGFVNSRVFSQPDPPPTGTLLVVEGRLVEVRVRSRDPALQRRLLRLVLPLQGQVLHLPSLEQTIQRLQLLPGIGGVSASLNRLGGDSTRGSLVLEAEPAPRRLSGELSLRNDGSSSNGQFRGLAVLSRDSLLRSADRVLLVGELNADDDNELGYRQLSLSYSLPLLEGLTVTTAAAASWRQLVEVPAPLHNLTFQQQQLLGQFDLTLHEGLHQRLSAFTGLSANRNEAWLNGARFPGIVGGAEDGALSTGYLRAGLNWEAWPGPVALNGSLYGLQGLAGFSGNRALDELAFFGIKAGEARALAGDLSLQWAPAPRWQLLLRGAGQVAFAPLTSAMGFTLGSDNGLRGLPGQAISGDSGLLGYGELSWTFWRHRNQDWQLVPFLGTGWVTTTLQGVSDDGSLGAGGVLLRWLQGRHWQVELGWASQFGDGLPADIPNLLLDNGFYSKVSYRF
ncbi:MAG: ShlB/FhaC/HecB family hemolysin secretion/activation protein [Cyanobacteriota bacterium]